MHFSELYYTNDITVFSELKFKNYIENGNLHGLADWLGMSYDELMNQIPVEGVDNWDCSIYLKNVDIESLKEDMECFNESFSELILADGVQLDSIVFFTSDMEFLKFEHVRLADDILERFSTKGTSLSVYRGKMNPYYSVVIRNKQFPFGKIYYVVPEMFLCEAMRLPLFKKLVFKNAEMNSKLRHLLMTYQVEFISMMDVQVNMKVSFMHLVIDEKFSGKKLVNICGLLIQYTPQEVKEKMLVYCKNQKDFTESGLRLAAMNILSSAPEMFFSGLVKQFVLIAQKAQDTLNTIECEDIAYNLMSPLQSMRDVALDRLYSIEDEASFG